MKGLIVYKGKYGATRQYAAWAGETLGFDVFTTKNLYRAWLEQADVVLIGTSVYMGKMLIRDWLRNNLETLHNKDLFLFVVCATPASESQKRDEIVNTNVPAQLLDRMHIFFLPGRLSLQQLSWRDRLILRIGRAVEKDPVKKEAMRHDLDEVKRENLEELITAARKYMPESILQV